MVLGDLGDLQETQFPVVLDQRATLKTRDNGDFLLTLISKISIIYSFKEMMLLHGDLFWFHYHK